MEWFSGAQHCMAENEKFSKKYTYLPPKHFQRENKPFLPAPSWYQNISSFTEQKALQFSILKWFFTSVSCILLGKADYKTGPT